MSKYIYLFILIKSTTRSLVSILFTYSSVVHCTGYACILLDFL